MTFKNLILTNGPSVKFIFKKKPKKISPNTDKVQNALTSKDFVEEIKSNEALVWGIDQDVTDIFTVGGSGSSSSKERIKKTSAKEYYHMRGLNLTTQECTQHHQHNQEDF
ncbi:hypothetical protein G6F46_008549 [Rhizopus delemar]|uniref:Uncharacterized protein n=3 Tax=Rhizopus TaxID=4842 RepID=I1C655_RHIO9|nr:hypothetical protein RO3G_08640 [Rhizopus delemar RA 99-880]KAG1454794.1 hypothetical protein G6F55_007419 [Rhizopus delemar]KAG1552443.1 hypothetical protein G6F51_001218 [Rhizopus arrhizus]KAG1494363.1 hypothetical protein G6F54_007926 [Rhizopus delemar]KAG1518443.1 hypothetical protein G6F53_000582 [Rhizopus delemar]|eukprot:EIE83935.1 hypothetical protein RO3G_08640 [Rhizopus delemar RA 99-880]